MKYAKILLNRNVLWIIGTLIILTVVTVMAGLRIHGEIEGTKKFRDTHAITLPKH